MMQSGKSFFVSYCTESTTHSPFPNLICRKKKSYYLHKLSTFQPKSKAKTGRYRGGSRKIKSKCEQFRFQPSTRLKQLQDLKSIFKVCMFRLVGLHKEDNYINVPSLTLYQQQQIPIQKKLDYCIVQRCHFFKQSLTYNNKNYPGRGMVFIIVVAYL